MKEKTRKTLAWISRSLVLAGCLSLLIAIVHCAIYLKEGADFTLRMLLWGAAYSFAGFVLYGINELAD